MRMRSKLLLVMLPLFIVTYIGHAAITYHTIREESLRDLHKEAEDIRAILMATRRVYHHTFLDSGLPLTDKTLPFLPAHALSRISNDFSSWTNNSMSFNNVSDRPRNPANTADVFEMEALNFFREHPNKKERFVEITTVDGKHLYHYTRPIWTEDYCMKCHGKQDVAPDSIRDRYSTAYDYTVGDLRGLMSIKLPTEAAQAHVMGSLSRLLPLTLVQYVIAFILIYSVLIRRTAQRLKTLETSSDALAAGEYDRIDPLNGDDEVAQLSRRFRDMANRVRRREGMLVERDERKDLALHGAGLGTWDWNVPTGEVAFSDRWGEMLGYDANELEPHEATWRNLVHPDDLPGVIKTLTAHLSGETDSYEVEHRLRHRSGQWVWVLARGRVIERDEHGQPVRACGTHMDITTRKLIEQLMFESEARFHAIFENIGSGIAIYEAVDNGEDFIFKDINPAGARIGHILREEHLGKRVTEVYPGVAKLGLLDVLREVDRSGEPRYYPLSTYRDNRITLWVQNYVCKLPSGEVVAMYDDLTEQKQAEAAIEQKLVALTQPLKDTEGIKLTDLFDIEDIQRLQDEFADATGVASLIEDTQGNALTRPSNFCRLCNDIIRQTEKGRINCCKSDVAIGRHNPEGPIVQPCLSGGLWDAGAAIAVGGKHIASWFIGQVRNEAQSEEKMRAYAREIETDEAEFIRAYHEVPSMSQERFNKIAQVLFTLSNQLSNIAYQNMQQARFITERKRAEEELRNSEERLSLALDVSGAGVWRWNVQSNEFQIDDKFLNMLGYDRSEIPTSKAEWQRLYHPDDTETMQAHREDHLQGDAPFYESEHRMLHKSGEWLWVYTRGRTITRDEAGRPEWCIGVVIDITDRKQAEEQLRSSEERYRNFVAHASEGIHRIDFTPPIPENLPDEEIVKFVSERAVVAEVNDALAQMYGLTPEDMIGKLATDFAPDYGERALWAIRAPQQQVRNVETLDQTKDGTPLYLAESYNAVIEDGLVVRIWGMQRNITERKRAEEAIRQAQAMLLEQQRTEKERVEEELAKAQRKLVTQTRLATIGQVAGSIAHELRNPLGAVRNAAFFLKRYASNEHPTTLKHLKIIEDEVTTANQIITDLMGVIRAEKPSKHPIKLDDLVRDVLERVHRPSGIQCRVDLSPQNIEVLADAIQLRQVLMNILTNAVQALGESGEIRITARQENACDAITIEDNGPGIQAESLDQVFEPLFTTKAKGTGLGLTICREMIERHGGTLDVATAELGGAAFSIRLPK